MKRKRVFQGILAMSYSKIAIALIQLATVPVLANEWGLPQYGQWLVLSSIPAFLAAGDLGFGSAAGNRLVGEVARGDHTAAKTTFQSAFGVVLTCGAVLFLLVATAAILLPASLLSVSGGMDAESARHVLIVLSLWALITMQSTLFLAVMRAHGGFAVSATLEATIQLLEGLTIIGIVGLGGTPIEAAIGTLAVRILGVVCHAALALHRSSWLTLGFASSTWHRTRELIRPSIAAMTLPLSQAGYLQGTALVVGAAVGAQAVPVVTTLRTLSRVAVQVLFSITVPVLPEFTAEHARGNTPWLQRVAGALIPVYAFVGAVAGLLLATLGEQLLQWWTRGSIAAPPAMITITSVSLMAAAVWNPVSSFLLAVNRHEAFTYVFGAFACGTLVLTYLLARRWGVTGAAIANLALDTTMLVCSLIQLRRVTGSISCSPLLTLGFIFPKATRNVGESNR